MADDWRVWGYSVEAGHPHGPAIFVWTYVDLSGRPDPDPVFDLAAAKVRAGMERFGARFGDLVVFSLIVLGCEEGDRAEEYAHQAYVRMWARHPRLWEAVQTKPFPVTFWMVGASNESFFGVVQPGLGPDLSSEVDWEQFVGRRAVSDACFRYHLTGVWGWMSVPQSLEPDTIAASRAGGWALRPAAPGTSPGE